MFSFFFKPLVLSSLVLFYLDSLSFCFLISSPLLLHRSKQSSTFRSLFFLRQVNGQWFLTALSQALFTMGPESDPRLRRQVDIALYATNPDGTLRPVPDAPAAPTTLSAMEAALAGVALTGPEVTE